MRLVKISTTDFAEEEKPEEVTVEEVQETDPMQKPDGTEAAPAEEEAGAPETLEVEEAVAEAEPEETKAA